MSNGGNLFCTPILVGRKVHLTIITPPPPPPPHHTHTHTHIHTDARTRHGATNPFFDPLVEKKNRV